MSAETPYETLAELRQDLASDDRGRFLDAADTIRDAGLSVDAVESDDPPVQQLVDAGIIPASGTPSPPADQQRGRIIELLESIEANTGGA